MAEKLCRRQCRDWEKKDRNAHQSFLWEVEEARDLGDDHAGTELVKVNRIKRENLEHTLHKIERVVEVGTSCYQVRLKVQPRGHSGPDPKQDPLVFAQLSVLFQFMFRIAQLLLLAVSVSGLSREELMEHLKSKQETANTFDSRIPRLIRPIGYIAGE